MFYFKSEEHFINFLRKNWVEELELNEEWIWIRGLYLKAEKDVSFYKEAFNSFTYMLRTEKQLKKTKILHLREIMTMENENDKYELLKEMEFVRKYDFNDFFKYTFDAQVSKKFVDELEKIRYKKGIYFLYNQNKELIYVGKSKNLCDRVPQSIKERKAFYFSYKLCKTLSDMHILELYFISKLKPVCNSDCKSEDDCHITIDYNFEFESDILSIF